MTQIFQAAAIAIATLGTGAATMTVMKGDIPDFAAPDGNWTAGSALDGRSFQIVGRDLKSGRVLDDEFVFHDGMFQSVNCQAYCDFGWTKYETKIDGDMIHFVARPACPDAPHQVVFYGTVQGDDVQFEGSWTTRRWYWTHQITFAGSGAPIPSTDTSVSG